MVNSHHWRLGSPTKSLTSHSLDTKVGAAPCVASAPVWWLTSLRLPCAYLHHTSSACIYAAGKPLHLRLGLYVVRKNKQRQLCPNSPPKQLYSVGIAYYDTTT